MTHIVPVTDIRGEARVSSRDLAAALGNQHKNVMSLIQDYKSEFEALGVLPFETEKPSEGSLGGRPTQSAHLNEDQCYFLLTLVRNSEVVVALKLQLVKAFAQARKLAATPAALSPTSPLALSRLMLESLEQQEARVAALEQRLDRTPISFFHDKEGVIYSLCQQFARVHPKSFAGAYRAFKEAFGTPAAPLAKYSSLPVCRFEEAVEWLHLQIRTYAAQRPLLDAVGD